MLFEKHLIEFPELADETLPSGQRYYRTPEGNKYPSVTTILGSMSDKTAIYEWRERIGYEKADKISKQAKDRGAAVHKVFEDYINDRLTPSEYQPIIYDLFLKGRRTLDEHITKIYGQEFCVYSDRLKTAGRCDLFADWDGAPAIIDFKGSSREKQLEWISGYIKQECTYSLCIREMKKIMVPKLVTIIVTEELPEAQVFVEDSEDWVKDTVLTFSRFHKKYPDYMEN